jgi:hypothetical protein
MPGTTRATNRRKRRQIVPTHGTGWDSKLQDRAHGKSKKPRANCYEKSMGRVKHAESSAMLLRAGSFARAKAKAEAEEKKVEE